MLKSIELFSTENSNILHLSVFITKTFDRSGQLGFI